MLLIGIIGGISSGKSAVAAIFAEYGAAVLDADRAGHEVLGRPEVIQALVSRWGNSILDEARQIHRPAVANIVFAPDAPAIELDYLEQITHPPLEGVLLERLAELRAQGVPAAVVDAALLVKAGWHRHCQKLVFVDVPRNVRWQRAAKRGWSEAQFEAREAAQGSLEERRRLADATIDNSGSIESTRQQVRACWEQWVGAMKK
jgi:dephospho-CoA kinase